MSPFPSQLKASPLTDYWRKPPSHDASNAPTHLLSYPSEHFRSALVTVSASWSRLYDQGGLLILLPTPNGEKRRWVKAGIEFAGGRPNLSVVATREWSDWSLHELEGDSVTIQIERESKKDARGTKSPSLFVYVIKDGKRADLPVREVTWAFEQEGNIDAGLYAARPTRTADDDDEGFTVQYEGVKVDVD